MTRFVLVIPNRYYLSKEYSSLSLALLTEWQCNLGEEVTWVKGLAPLRKQNALALCSHNCESSVRPPELFMMMNCPFPSSNPQRVITVCVGDVSFCRFISRNISLWRIFLYNFKETYQVRWLTKGSSPTQPSCLHLWAVKSITPTSTDPWTWWEVCPPPFPPSRCIRRAQSQRHPFVRRIRITLVMLPSRFEGGKLTFHGIFLA